MSSRSVLFHDPSFNASINTLRSSWWIFLLFRTIRFNSNPPSWTWVDSLLRICVQASTLEVLLPTRYKLPLIDPMHRQDLPTICRISASSMSSSLTSTKTIASSAIFRSRPLANFLSMINTPFLEFLCWSRILRAWFVVRMNSNGSEFSWQRHSRRAVKYSFGFPVKTELQGM